jgi:hypothetical protein
MQTTDRRRSQGQRVWYFRDLAAVALLVVIQQTASLEDLNLFGRTLSNILHFPLFVIITLLLARAFPSLSLPAIGTIAFCIGVITEAIQLFNQRHASFFDVALNASGIAVALMGLAIVRSWQLGRANTHRHVVLWSSIGAMVIAITVAAPLRVLLAYDQRDRSFPVIWEASAWPGTLMLDGNSDFRLVTAPDDWRDHAGQRVLEVTWADVQYPRLQMLEVVPDWSGYDTIDIEAYLAEGPPLSMTAALGHRGEMVARRLSTVRVQPGANLLTFELSEFAVDVSANSLERFVLRAPNSAANRSLLIARIALSKSAVSPAQRSENDPNLPRSGLERPGLFQ